MCMCVCVCEWYSDVDMDMKQDQYVVALYRIQHSSVMGMDGRRNDSRAEAVAEGMGVLN
jgi:hypothetical protein